MNFASIEFLLFFAAFLPVFLLLRSDLRLPFLLGASWFFYAWWKPPFLILLILTTAGDFWAGLWLARLKSKPARRMLLTVSVGVNLSVLFFFKYSFFTAHVLNTLAEFTGVHTRFPLLQFILPLGISFYTFHSISYMVDVYRGRIEPEKKFLRYSLYVCFFPLLVAGPIERANRLLPRFASPIKPLDAAQFLGGFTQALFGLWKKLVIADVLAFPVERAFSNPSDYSGGTLLVAIYAFAFQIYCDFSGYSDIALGTARMMGYDLRENFQAPYFATSLTDFWRRWHISLSTWLRDYLYIPLGGSREGGVKTYRNLLIVMILGGLWHGAAWTFIFWGSIHGLWLCVEKFLRLPERLANVRVSSPVKRRLWRGFRILVTFHIVCLGWIFFRARNFTDAFTILSRLTKPDSLLQFHIIDRVAVMQAVPALLLLLVLEFFWLRCNGFSEAFQKLFADSSGRSALRIPLLFNAFLILCILLFGVEGGSRFIYFQF